MTISRTTSKTSRLPDASAPAPAAPKVHVVTFGCQMNKYDSRLAEGRFKRAGYATTEHLHEADVVLFNTCSVRDHAEERTYSWLGELKRAKDQKPGLVIGVMGCMAQRVGEEIFARAGHVDIVAGTRQFANLPALVERVHEARASRTPNGKAARVLALEMDDRVQVDRDDERYDGGLHAYLTVMRGCDLNCTYCIVPSVRGRVMSYPIDHLVHEAESYVAQGARVITLLGQTVNSYGEDVPAPSAGAPRGLGRQGRPALADLLYRLQEVRGLARIRLITLHPAYVTEALGDALRDCPKAERFLPIPAQSGSDAILRAMKRGYTTDLYRRRMDGLRARVPDIELGSDWIAGFCGETDADHTASEQFMSEQGFVTNYVFKYDPRPGTHAADALADDVPEAVKKERNQRLLARGEELGLRRMSAHVGAVRDVFVEAPSERAPGRWVGRTEHGLMVHFGAAGELAGSTVRVRIESAAAYGLAGELADEPAACPAS